jgi:hypothetical protein
VEGSVWLGEVGLDHRLMGTGSDGLSRPNTPVDDYGCGHEYSDLTWEIVVRLNQVQTWTDSV